MRNREEARAAFEAYTREQRELAAIRAAEMASENYMQVFLDARRIPRGYYTALSVFEDYLMFHLNKQRIEIGE